MHLFIRNAFRKAPPKRRHRVLVRGISTGASQSAACDEMSLTPLGFAKGFATGFPKGFLNGYTNITRTMNEHSQRNLYIYIYTKYKAQTIALRVCFCLAYKMRF